MRDLGERVWERLDHLTWVRYKDKYGAMFKLRRTPMSPAVLVRQTGVAFVGTISPDYLPRYVPLFRAIADAIEQEAGDATIIRAEQQEG